MLFLVWLVLFVGVRCWSLFDVVRVSLLVFVVCCCLVVVVCLCSWLRVGLLLVVV